MAMATGGLSDYDFHTKDDDMQVEIFCLIWLDANASAKETRNTEKQLRSIINQLKKFQDVKQCQTFIEERSKNDRITMIVSGSYGRKIVPVIHKLRQVISIYVYCMDKKANEEWSSKYSKVKAVVTELDELITRLRTDHKIQKKIEEPIAFTTSTGGGTSTMGINGQFVFSQVLIDCLLRLKYSDIDKKELIKRCKQQYNTNDFELSNIREFNKNYSPNKALWWYTLESFFYKTLNAALRDQNIHMIFLFRQFIADIHDQLKSNQVKKRLRVYRGQMISKDELKALKNCVGKFISVNSFFSTSTDYEQALTFLNASDTTDKIEPILFEIDADPRVVNTKPFADISRFGDFPEEAEVLFMLGSIFRLNGIDRSDDGQISIIRMSLCSDDEHELQKVLTYMKHQTGTGETNLHILGKLLSGMGKFDLAEKYFNSFVEQLPAKDPFLVNIYEDLAQVAGQKGDYDKAIEWRQKAMEINSNQLTPVPIIAKSTKSRGKLVDSSIVNLIFI